MCLVLHAFPISEVYDSPKTESSLKQPVLTCKQLPTTRTCCDIFVNQTVLEILLVNVTTNCAA